MRGPQGPQPNCSGRGRGVGLTASHGRSVLLGPAWVLGAPEAGHLHTGCGLGALSRPVSTHRPSLAKWPGLAGLGARAAQPGGPGVLLGSPWCPPACSAHPEERRCAGGGTAPSPQRKRLGWKHSLQGGWQEPQGPVLFLEGTSPRPSRALWGPRALPLPASQLLWVCVLGTPVTVDSTFLSGQEAVPITLRRALPTPTGASSQGPASCPGPMSTGRPQWSHLLRAARINRINLP